MPLTVPQTVEELMGTLTSQVAVRELLPHEAMPKSVLQLAHDVARKVRSLPGNESSGLTKRSRADGSSRRAKTIAEKTLSVLNVPLDIDQTQMDEFARTVEKDSTRVVDLIIEWLANMVETLLYNTLVEHWASLLVLLFISKAPGIASKNVPGAVNSAHTGGDQWANHWHKEQDPGQMTRDSRKKLLFKFLKWVSLTTTCKYHGSVNEVINELRGLYAERRQGDSTLTVSQALEPALEDQIYFTPIIFALSNFMTASDGELSNFLACLAVSTKAQRSYSPTETNSNEVDEEAMYDADEGHPPIDDEEDATPASNGKQACSIKYIPESKLTDLWEYSKPLPSTLGTSTFGQYYPS